MKTTVLQEYREKSGLSYEQIAESTGLARSTVFRFFTDPNYNPNISTVYAIVVLIGGSIDAACDMLTPLPDNGTADRALVNVAITAHNQLVATTNARIKDLRHALIASVAFNVLFVAFILCFTIYDLTHPNLGFIQYTVSLSPNLSTFWDSVTLWAKDTFRL